MTSSALASLVAGFDEHINTLTSRLLATRLGCEMITAGCGSGQPGGCQVRFPKRSILLLWRGFWQRRAKGRQLIKLRVWDLPTLSAFFWRHRFKVLDYDFHGQLLDQLRQT